MTNTVKFTMLYALLYLFTMLLFVIISGKRKCIVTLKPGLKETDCTT